MEILIEVAKVEDISPGRAKLIHFGYQSIAIFNVGGPCMLSTNTPPATVGHSPTGA
jgi:hypothetical protein